MTSVYCVQVPNLSIGPSTRMSKIEKICRKCVTRTDLAAIKFNFDALIDEFVAKIRRDDGDAAMSNTDCLSVLFPVVGRCSCG